jgi:hypothetical protein
MDYSTGQEKPLKFFLCMRWDKKFVFVSQAVSDSVAQVAIDKRQYVMMEKIFETRCHPDILWVLISLFEDEVSYGQFFYGGGRFEKTIRLWKDWQMPPFVAEALEARLHPLMPDWCYACHRRRAIKDGRCGSCQAVNLGQVEQVKEEVKNGWKTPPKDYLPKVNRAPVKFKKKYKKKKNKLWSW